VMDAETDESEEDEEDESNAFKNLPLSMN